MFLTAPEALFGSVVRMLFGVFNIVRPLRNILVYSYILLLGCGTSLTGAALLSCGSTVGRRDGDPSAPDVIAALRVITRVTCIAGTACLTCMFTIRCAYSLIRAARITLIA